MSEKEFERDCRDRIELAEHERFAEDMGLEFEEYVQQIIIPIHLCGGMPIFGILRRTELWALDSKLGENWWRKKS